MTSMVLCECGDTSFLPVKGELYCHACLLKGKLISVKEKVFELVEDDKRKRNDLSRTGKPVNQ